MDGTGTLFLISALRISKKLYMEVIREKGPVRKGKRTLIVGVGNTGEMILRDMARNGYDAARSADASQHEKRRQLRAGS